VDKISHKRDSASAIFLLVRFLHSVSHSLSLSLKK
jgi:hypothetical protein